VAGRHPAPLQRGDQAHLTDGTIRASLARGMRLVAAQLGVVPDQYRALLNGADVTVTREQITGWVGPSQWPANVTAHAEWTLSGNDTLTPTS
jgi:hypothetical protein